MLTVSNTISHINGLQQWDKVDKNGGTKFYRDN